MKKIFYVIIVFSLFCYPVPNLLSKDTSDGSIDRKRNTLIGYILSQQLPALHFSDKQLNDELAEAAFNLYIKQLDYQKRFLFKKDVEQMGSFAPYIDDNLANGRTALPDVGYDILNEKVDLVQKMVAGMLTADQLIISNDAKTVVTKWVNINYVVKPGDTLYSISTQFDDVTVDSLAKRNSIANRNVLVVGQKLVIPQKKIGHTDVFQVGLFEVTKDEFYETDPEKTDFAEDFDELRERWRKLLKSQLIGQYLFLKEKQQKKDQEQGRDEKLQGEPKSDQELWREAMAKVAKRNNTFFERLHKETVQDHYDRFFNSVTRAFDPHTNYIPPAGKEQFDINMRGSLEGIGALLREDDGFIKVVRIIPGSASARQGRLKAEDIILEVAQEGGEPVDITDMRLRDAVRLIRGPKGEAVSLTVKKSDGTTEIIQIIRDVVQIEETFVKSTVIESGGGRKIGYIYIPSFYRDFEGTRNGAKGRNSTEDTLKEIERLKSQNIEGIVLDLRDDGGGALVDAVDITGLFIESGPVVQVKNSFGEMRVLYDQDEKISYGGPLVVMVNKFSASASEIVAAAIKDYGRGVIVGGKHTHGKGTVQTIINLNDNIPLLNLRRYADLGALKVMIQKFYRVNGSSTQYKGVVPDIILPDLFEYVKSGERYLDYSLPWDSIAPVDFVPWSGGKFDIELLRKLSLDRVLVDEGMKIIQEEVKRSIERSENTAISINIDEMKKKRDEAELMREKVGAHFKKYRSNGTDDESYEKELDNKMDPQKAWVQNVNEDPYVREAANIVSDMIKLGWN